LAPPTVYFNTGPSPLPPVSPLPVAPPQVAVLKTKKKKMKAVVTYYTTSDDENTSAY